MRGSPVGSPLSDTENLRCAVTRDDFEVLKRNLIGIGQSEQLFLLAAQQGKARSVAYFLDSGVNMNERDVNGSTALILASGAGHAELVRILLVRGVDVLLADANSRTCLHVAAALGHQVHVLLRIPAAVCCICSTALRFAGCAVDNPRTPWINRTTACQGSLEAHSPPPCCASWMHYMRATSAARRC